MLKTSGRADKKNKMMKRAVPGTSKNVQEYNEKIT